MAVANTIAYYDTRIITTVISFYGYKTQMREVFQAALTS
jgi:hypothetical protein